MQLTFYDYLLNENKQNYKKLQMTIMGGISGKVKIARKKLNLVLFERMAIEIDWSLPQ